ncbi:Rqc2 family fibronectin-binding protein [Acetohalobium arabaticum]|uniref:Rqc2 homolog RqcH n=1 Tax=Acetohalobium arabaticum (strain ATCC 49924 / DSM 5501 / Z-7288) TaxID=574087 RepID=D9QPP7_ACEAZ|nr:NFACT RNA binding domain-containing protein [Acetohalobium arabaticum]ADL12488.1 Fibronectin-binding A domain protein [Acetohalobium arabaticum DSM 5501]
MALDGLTLQAIKIELEEELIGGRLDKIYQPKENLLTLRFRQPGENIKLLLSASPQNPRIHITDSDHENPLRPPTFCMLLRKHLEHGRLRKIEQPDFERILKIYIDSKNNQGEIETKILLIEVMGRHSNIILIDNKNQILDSIKRVTSDMSRHREILPGHEYKKPPKQGKTNPLTVKKDEFIKRIKSADIEKKVYRAIMDNIRGISPLIAKELAYRTGLNKNDKIRKISSISLEKLWPEFKKLIEQIKAEDFEPNLIIEDDKFKAYSVTELTSLSEYQKKKFATANELLDYYFTTKIRLKEITDLKNSLKGVTSDNIEKAMKKYRRVKGQLKGARNAEKYRIKGELIKANIYRIKPGQTKLEATNYYSDEEETVNIQLDADLSPAENAQKYFKKYDKAKKSVDYLENELRKAKNEVNYLKQVEVLVEQAENIEDLQELKEELTSEGYIKKQKSKKDSRKNKSKKSEPLKFKSSDGFDIRVGRNNHQNDKLVKYESSDQDLWLHAKDIPGSHVIIKNHTRDEVPQNTIEEAAHLAAYYSKGKNSSNVPVDYALAKHVNKPKGAKPGMVYYENQQTLYVTPQQEIIEEMDQQ